MADIAGLPFWEFHFDEVGRPKNTPGTIPPEITDLFVFSHGWNNDYIEAKDMYARFFEAMAELLLLKPAKDGVHIGLAGVFWPSVLWPDDEPELQSTGMASFGPVEKDWTTELKKAYTEADQHAAIDRMRELIDARPNEPEAMDEFQGLLKRIAPASSSAEDSGEGAVLEEDPRLVFEALAKLAPADRGGEVGLFDGLSRVWDGAKEAARVTSYWNMKERAGVVGEKGLGPVLKNLRPGLRVHLLGHSFGARLVSFALRADPGNVKSLFLIQGAFSHYAFADSLPHAPTRGGALKGLASRVDGPILVTHSKLDAAVCERYPVASWIARQSEAAITDDPKWMAMGADGAQAVNAVSKVIEAVGFGYEFAKGKFLNLDGNHIITKGGWPSGAHSDIVHPEIAWASLAAANVV